MKTASSSPHLLTAAQRGQIVQRVIVDNWTTADAAIAAGVPERVVVAWVAGFRRHGLASLHHRPGKSVRVEIADLPVLRPVRSVFRSFATRMRWLFASDRRLAEPSSIRRPQDDRREGGS
jgi:hypothetical protein